MKDKKTHYELSFWTEDERTAYSWLEIHVLLAERSELRTVENDQGQNRCLFS